MFAANHICQQPSPHPFSYLDSLCFFMYLLAQLPHGRFPSHLVFRDRHRSQLAHNATVPSCLGFSSGMMRRIFRIYLLIVHLPMVSEDIVVSGLFKKCPTIGVMEVLPWRK